MVEDEVRHLDVDGSRFSFRVKLTGQAMAVPLDWNPPKNDTADPWIRIISSEEFECGEELHVYTALSDLTDEDLEAAARRLSSVVPLVDGPYVSVRNLNQEELNDYLDRYNEFAEFIIELTRIDEAD